jgi:hypothetical protein
MALLSYHHFQGMHEFWLRRFLRIKSSELSHAIILRAWSPELLHAWRLTFSARIALISGATLVVHPASYAAAGRSAMPG